MTTLTKGVAWADAYPNGMSDMESLLLERINQARSNPLETATDLGLDPQALLAKLPALADGLPLLEENDYLRETAYGHTNDMLANDYYAKDALDGRTFEDRILTAGYLPLAVGETLGVVGFINLIVPEKAVDLLFENMFKDEFHTDNDNPHNLLNPDFVHVGIAIESGTLTLGGTLYNVYLATCDFGTPQQVKPPQTVEEAETTLIHLINQARQDPIGVAATLDLDLWTILKLWFQLADIQEQGMPALAQNDALEDAARQHTQEMVEFRYFDKLGVDGRSVEESLLDRGYNPLDFERVIDIVALEADIPLDEVVMEVFRSLFLKQLDQDDPGLKAIFSPAFTEIGVGLRPLVPQEGEQFNHVYLVTCDFALPVESHGTYLSGMVYMDWNGNGLFDAGEGLSDTPVYIDHPDLDVNLTTDAIGGFQELLGPGPARIVLWPGQDEQEFWVDLDQVNQWVACLVVPDAGIE